MSPPKISIDCTKNRTAILTSLPKPMTSLFKNEFEMITGHQPYPNDPDVVNTFTFFVDDKDVPEVLTKLKKLCDKFRGV